MEKIKTFNIKLEEAKKAFGIHNFKKDDLLIIALIDARTLNEMRISLQEQHELKRKQKQLAFLGDSLFDSVLADYLYRINPKLTHQKLDDWRQEIASKDSLTQFAIELGLPKFCSSWNKIKEKPPEKEPRIWAEMFEALVGVIFIDSNRDFLKLSKWLVDNFIRYTVCDDNDPDYENAIYIDHEDYGEGADCDYYYCKDDPI